MMLPPAAYIEGVVCGVAVVVVVDDEDAMTQCLKF